LCVPERKRKTKEMKPERARHVRSLFKSLLGLEEPWSVVKGRGEERGDYGGMAEEL
jgi:hypothetical protein